MAKKEKKRKHRRLSVRMARATLLVVFIVTLLGILNSTYRAMGIMAIDWIDSGKTVSLAASGAVDYENARKMADVIASDEVKTMKEKAASDEEYTQALTAYLEEKGVAETMERASTAFHRIERTLNGDDVILITCREEFSCLYVAASTENLHHVGTTDMINIHMMEDETPGLGYATTDRPDGQAAFCTFIRLGEETRKGEVMYIGVERNVISVLKQFSSYIKSMLWFLLIVAVVCAVLGSLLSRQLFAVPILKLKKSAEDFRAANSTEQSAVPIRADVHTRDEIEDLSDSLYDLETSVVETQQKLREEYIEKGRMSEQLQLASEIQNGVLPTDFPDNEQYNLYAIMHPARQVGGDFYDFFMMPDQEHLALVIGDVSDKGIAAALFMMAGKTTLRSVALSEDDPAKILEKVNNMMLEQNPMSMFITIWIGILNLKTGVLRTASAGHEYPFMALDGKPFEMIMDIHGLVVAEMPNMKYKTCTYELHKGDRIFVYTDGATDAMNTEKQQIGAENLLELVKGAADDKSAKGIVNAVKGKIDAFSEGAAQFDDITILSLTYLNDPVPLRPQKPGEIAGDILPLS